MMRPAVSLVWLRRDLRLDDNTALFAAARESDAVACVFVLDPPLLRGDRVGAPIVQSFFSALAALRAELRAAGSDLIIREGDAAAELAAAAAQTGASRVYANADVDPAAIARDERVARSLAAGGIALQLSADLTYFAPGDVLQERGTPYTVYAPYRRRWLARFAREPQLPVPSLDAVRRKLLPAERIAGGRAVPQPEEYGHLSSAQYPAAGAPEARRLLRRFGAHAQQYAQSRNMPALDGTSRLSPHLRAGTIGIRTCVHDDAARSAAWLDELIWRDFYAQLLAHHPRVAGEPFVAAARAIAFRDDEEAFAAWCEARTGYPIVDAAMTQLVTTGWMHNRLRMIVASFLSKHLLIAPRHGERFFEQHLADADLPANNGGWQWASSTGTDAAPYFRVFNPTLQAKTFDPDGAFVRAMLPALRGVPLPYVHEPWRMPPLLQAEFGCVVGRDYPAPIVEHAAARERALAVFGAALRRRD